MYERIDVKRLEGILLLNMKTGMMMTVQEALADLMIFREVSVDPEPEGQEKPKGQKEPEREKKSELQDVGEKKNGAGRRIDRGKVMALYRSGTWTVGMIAEEMSCSEQGVRNVIAELKAEGKL